MVNKRALRRRIRRLEKQVKLIANSGFKFKPEIYTGTWSGWDLAVNRNGPVRTFKKVVLSCDQNGSLQGTVSWQAFGDPLGFDATQGAVASDSEEVIGLVETSTGAVLLVEKEEAGTFKGSVLPDGSLRLRQTQPGQQPVVAVMHLSRS